MKKYLNDQPEFEQYIREQFRQGMDNLPDNLLIIGDFGQAELTAGHICRELELLNLLQRTGHSDFIYHTYEMVPGIPNEGLLNFYQHLFTVDKRMRKSLPAAVIIEISSCVKHLDSLEFQTLLSFACLNQRSTLFIFLLDRSLMSRAAKVKKRMKRVLPVMSCTLFEKSAVAG